MTPQPRPTAMPAAPPVPRSLLAGLLGAALSIAGAAGAGPLADPTRPPTAAASTASGSARAGTGAAAARAPAPVEPAAPLPVLQSVQQPARGPAVAMVDGQLFRAGDTIAGRLVLSIDSQGLVLDGRGGSERVWLLAGSPKQAPGSILTLRTASFQPAAPTAETAEGGGTPVRAERGGSPSPQPASPGPLSVAGRNQP